MKLLLTQSCNFESLKEITKRRTFKTNDIHILPYINLNRNYIIVFTPKYIFTLTEFFSIFKVPARLGDDCCSDSTLQGIRLNSLEFLYFFQNYYHLRFQTSPRLYLSTNTIGAPTSLLVLDTSEICFLVFLTNQRDPLNATRNSSTEFPHSYFFIYPLTITLSLSFSEKDFFPSQHSIQYCISL